MFSFCIRIFLTEINEEVIHRAANKKKTTSLQNHLTVYFMEDIKKIEQDGRYIVGF